MNYSIGEFNNFIGGKWRDGGSGRWAEQICPMDGSVVSRSVRSTVSDVQDAVQAAKKAFETEDWAFNPRRRSAALQGWAHKMRQEHKELARLLTIQTGKPIGESMGEIAGSIGYLEFYAAAARTLYGATTSIDPNTLSVLCREPVGVVGTITPWNYPITLLMRDLAPALAAGNTAVIKSAEMTSAITMVVVKLMEDIPEFPVGAVNAVCGQGCLIGSELVKNPDVDMINLTGGSEVGKDIMRNAADTMKKLSLELGGKSASIIYADADMEKALPYALKSIFTNAGQLCTSASRFLIEESIAETFMTALKKRAEELKVGNGLDETVQMGSIISEGQLQSIMKYIEIGKKDGKLLTGGKRITANGLDKGCYLEPTIFYDLPFDSPIVQEEVFGPVLCLQTFKTEEEAVHYANGTRFGLASGVWSKDIDKAMRTARKLRAGTTWVNCYNRLLPEAETGGYKESGIDRAGGIEGITKFTEIKHLCIDYGPM